MTTPSIRTMVTQAVPEFNDANQADEAWRDLQDVLEERDAEWWAEQNAVAVDRNPAVLMPRSAIGR